MPTNPFNLTPKQAAAWFKAKLAKPSLTWRDFMGAEHNAVFTVSKLLNLELLDTVKREMERAIEEGKTVKEFAENLKPAVERAGWLATAEKAASRLAFVFRTNMATAYAAQYYEATKRYNKGYYLYNGILDDRIRPEHKAWDGKILPVNSPWWNTHYPPNGWGCRCNVIWIKDLSLVGRKAPNREPIIEYDVWTNPDTGKAEKVPAGIDPGWDYNPGIKGRQKSLNASLANKT